MHKLWGTHLPNLNSDSGSFSLNVGEPWQNILPSCFPVRMYSTSDEAHSLVGVWRSAHTLTRVFTLLCFCTCFPGHLVTAAVSCYHCYVLQTIVRGLPKDWKHPRGRPRSIWLSIVESDLATCQQWTLICLETWDHTVWSWFVEMAMLQPSACPWWR